MGKVKTINKFAWLPLDIEGKFVWFKSYKVDYKVVLERHYCHDCTNSLAPCGGQEYDTYLTFIRAYV